MGFWSSQLHHFADITPKPFTFNIFIDVVGFMSRDFFFFSVFSPSFPFILSIFWLFELYLALHLNASIVFSTTSLFLVVALGITVYIFPFQVSLEYMLPF